jgi:hypothetical protein
MCVGWPSFTHSLLLIIITQLGSATYGVAEQAAVIIQSNAFTVPSSASHSKSSSIGQFVPIPWLATILLLCLAGLSFI